MAKFTAPLGYDCLRISTPCKVDATDYEKSSEMPDILQCSRADWDTGATVTVISERVVAELGLIPIGKTKISGYNGKPTITNEYRIDLLFDGDVRINFIKAVEAPLLTMDILVGMNVINQGDFHIDFCNGKKEFSFRIESYPPSRSSLTPL